MAHNDENLHTLISTDLEYLIAWSYRWLVKFNPNKNRYYLQGNRMGNIVNKEAPDYLYELVPPLVAANVNYTYIIILSISPLSIKYLRKF
jgi:hypothetical protein